MVLLSGVSDIIENIPTKRIKRVISIIREKGKCYVGNSQKKTYFYDVYKSKRFNKRKYINRDKEDDIKDEFIKKSKLWGYEGTKIMRLRPSRSFNALVQHFDVSDTTIRNVTSDLRNLGVLIDEAFPVIKGDKSFSTAVSFRINKTFNGIINRFLRTGNKNFLWKISGLFHKMRKLLKKGFEIKESAVRYIKIWERPIKRSYYPPPIL